MSYNPHDQALNQVKHSNGDTSLSVVVPVYNSEGLLDNLVTRLEIVLPGLADQFELILINDGSRDRSWQVVEDLATRYQWVKGINLMRNYGQHNALLCGILDAQYEIIVTMDDDLQHPPEEIHRLLEKLTEGYDVVYGMPHKEQHNLWRDMASRLTKTALQGIMGTEIARNVGPFRAFRTHLRNAFSDYRGEFVFIDALLTWATFRFAAVTVPHNPRLMGASNYNFRKLVVHALNMMTSFSAWPLQFASMTGFFFTLFGLGVFLYVMWTHLILGYSVPGFTFLASIISIFSGAQLFALGIIGEYLARIHFRSMGRPYAIVREKIGYNNKGEAQ